MIPDKKHFARSLNFRARIPAANAASALAALKIMQREPERIQRVNDIGEKMRHAYRSLGFNLGDSQSPIVPIIIGDDELTFVFWKRLFESGVFVNPVISPAVQNGNQLLRTSYMATHTDDQLNFVIEIMGKVGRELGVI